MLRPFISILIYQSLLTILTANPAASQVQEYIDLNYGDQGSIKILDRIAYPGLTDISYDSLDNIYISFRFNDNGKHSLIKVNREGTIDSGFQNSPLIQESEDQYFQRDNYIYFVKVIGGSTVVNIYDLNLNLVKEYRLAEVAEFKNLHYYRSGYFVGVTENFVFRYLPDGTLDTSFGTDGLIDINALIGEYEWGTNRYEFQNESGDYYLTFIRVGPSSSYNLVRIDKDGQYLNTFNIAATYSSLDNAPDLVDHKIFSVTPIQNGKILIAGTGWNANFNTNRFYFLVVNQDFSLDTSYGVDGMTMLPSGFETRYVAGAFSNNQALLRTGTYDDSEIETIAIIDKGGSLRYDLSDKGFLNLDIKENAYSFRILSIDNDIYVLHLSFADKQIVLTKLNLDNILVNKNLTAIVAETQLSPNPTSSLTNLLYTGPTLKNALLHIYSTTGELIREQNIEILTQNQTIEISTANITEGHYIVTLIHNGQIISSSKMTIVK